MTTFAADPAAPALAPATVRFVPVTAADVGRLATTAREAYLAHYHALWSDAGEGYVARSFAPAVLLAELAAAGTDYRFIDTPRATAGFLKCVRPPVPTSPAPAPAGYLYLERLYLLPGCAGQGIGSAALEFVAALAQLHGLAGVWLRAMADEPRVIRFYERHGFLACGSDRLSSPGVVAGRDQMLRMMWKLRTDSA